jgi:hypothetical protein
LRLPTVLGSFATCGHTTTGNPRVTVEGIPISLIGVSTAGAPIIGPGSPRVTVAGITVSTFGDIITAHGEPPHSNPTTTTLATRVFVP